MEIDLTNSFEEVLTNNKIKYLKSQEEIDKLSKKTFMGLPFSDFGLKKHIFNEIPINEVILGFTISGGAVIFSKKMFCISNTTDSFDNIGFSLLPIEEFIKLEIESGSTTFSDYILLDGIRVGSFNRQSENKWKQICDILNPCISNYFKNKLKLEKEESKIKEEKRKEQELLKEEQRLKELKVSQTNLLSELDKDGNGEVDVIEGNDFNVLLKKHQRIIAGIDRNYIQQFVKISSYLKTKKNNIQLIFNSIKDTPNEETLNQYVEILKDDIHSYNLILFSSLNMIVSLVEDDMITFYELHEMFDNLNIFDSKHEKDISQKLTNIGDGLKDLMYSIEEMGRNIENQMGELTYVTEQTNRVLDNQLQSIDSSIQTNKLLTDISAYQTYKLRKGS